MRLFRVDVIWFAALLPQCSVISRLSKGDKGKIEIKWIACVVTIVELQIIAKITL